MAFDHESLAKAKEAVTRMSGRMANIRKDNERAITRIVQGVGTVGTCFGWSYANAKWGEVHENNAGGLAELAVVGIPADLASGIGLYAVSFFGGFGKWDELGFSVGIGSACAFTARMGTEMGAKSATDAPAKKTKTAGEMSAGRGPHGGRVHSVWPGERQYADRAA